MTSAVLDVGGFRIYRTHVPPANQAELLGQIRDAVRSAPLFSPVTPGGTPMRVRMTSAGRYGWFSDRAGYRYIETHPAGTPWPPVPAMALSLWRALVSETRAPDCCLINFYGENARMGLHRDADEADFSWPVLSISLGDPGRFRMGGTARSDPTSSLWLESGDVVVMGGSARLAYHGIDRIRFGASRLLPQDGRINLTLRVVD